MLHHTAGDISVLPIIPSPSPSPGLTGCASLNPPLEVHSIVEHALASVVVDGMRLSVLSERLQTGMQGFGNVPRQSYD